MSDSQNRYQTVVNDLSAMGFTFRVNDLDESIEYSVSNGGWKQLGEIDEAIIRTDMRELGYGVSGSGKCGKGALKDAIMKNANDNRYNRIQEYLESLDGKYKPSENGPYLIPTLATYVNNPDGMFGTWLFKWMVGAIAKAIEGARNPMLILVGPQKTGKSYLSKWLCPHPEHFVRDSINPDDKDSHILLTNMLIWEVEELGATTRRSDVESLKAFITRDFVKKRPAYGKSRIDKPAVCSFIGTVNFDGAGFLNDVTGTTRFLSCEVKGINFDYTQMDVNQLWAEAYWFYKNVAHCWELTKADEATQARINAVYEVPSALEDTITEIFEITRDNQDYMSSKQIRDRCAQHYRITSDELFFRELNRVLTKLNIEKGRKRFSDGKQRQAWVGIKPYQVIDLSDDE